MFHKKGTVYICRKQTSRCKIVKLGSFTGFLLMLLIGYVLNILCKRWHQQDGAPAQ